MSGRYRVATVLCAGYAAGLAVGLFGNHWWASLLVGAVFGWFAERLARWIAKP